MKFTKLFTKGFIILFSVFSLYSCVSETCVTCSKEGMDDIENCSDGSIIGDGALETWRIEREAEGYNCN